MSEIHICEHCGRKYRTSTGLGRHVMMKHPAVVEAQLEPDRRKVTA